MSQNKSKLPIMLLLLVIIAAAVGFYMYQQNQTEPPMNAKTASMTEYEATQTEAEVSASGDVQDAAEIEDAQETDNVSADDNSETNGSDSLETTATTSIDVASALSERSIGAADAPVVIREHSSFTCGHCGDFHKTTYAQLKSEYIDTGKVRLVFSDFPLNGPALHASMIARCLPQDRYFDFIDLLFKTQDKWAYEANYINYLRQNSALAGLSSEAFDACLNNEELKSGLTDAMRAAQQKYSINSTPTFVFNEDNVISGARNFEFYKDVIEKELIEAAN